MYYHHAIPPKRRGQREGETRNKLGSEAALCGLAKIEWRAFLDESKVGEKTLSLDNSGITELGSGGLVRPALIYAPK